MVRLASAAVLGVGVAFLSLAPLFVLALGVEGLDGVGAYWDGRCERTSRAQSAAWTASGVLVLCGLWGAYARAVRGRCPSRRAPAAIMVGIVLWALGGQLPEPQSPVAGGATEPVCEA